jgi:hypothetical protein
VTMRGSVLTCRYASQQHGRSPFQRQPRRSAEFPRNIPDLGLIRHLPPKVEQSPTFRTTSARQRCTHRARPFRRSRFGVASAQPWSLRRASHECDVRDPVVRPAPRQ